MRRFLLHREMKYRTVPIQEVPMKAAAWFTMIVMYITIIIGFGLSRQDSCVNVAGVLQKPQWVHGTTGKPCSPP